MISTSQIEVLKRVEKLAFKEELALYLVGGAVRDEILNIPFKDFDFVFQGDSSKFALILATEFACSFKEFKNFFTAKVFINKEDIAEVDLASARSEIYESGGSLPKVTPTSINEDLKRRDFSINSMAIRLEDFLTCIQSGISLESKIIDQFSGLEDLRNHKIKVLHSKSFLDDPTRIFRSIRYAARITGVLELNTEKLLQEALHCKALDSISKFRIFNELKNILSEKEYVSALKHLDNLGVFISLKLGQENTSSSIVFELIQTMKRAKSNISLSNEDLTKILIFYFIKDNNLESQSSTFNSWNIGLKALRATKEIFYQLGVCKSEG